MNRTMIKIGMAALAMGTVAAWAGEKEIEAEGMMAVSSVDRVMLSDQPGRP